MFALRKLVALLAFAACLLGAARAGQPGTDVDPDKERHLALGMPAEAKTDEESKDAYLLKKDFFSLSYNNSKGTPNWVAWNLVKTDFETAKRPRPAPFHPDGDLPAGLLKVRPTDYMFASTGFERGHMCPNADRDFSKERATKTFVMTNMVPQTAELNEKAWGKLEDYCRGLVADGDELFIYAGPAGMGGWSSKGYFNTTNGKVVVPAKCWKVIVCLPAGNAPPLERIDSNTRIIAVIMPNDQTPTNAWGKWRVTVADVEKLTGFTFFDKVKPEVRDVLVKELDNERIPDG